MIVFVVAHPDDELLTFAHALLTEKEHNECTVISVTRVDGEWRNEAFYKFCAENNIQAIMLGAEDKIDEGIFDDLIVNRLTDTLASLGKIERVYTHCPSTGDKGAHQHHMDVGLMTRLALMNVEPERNWTADVWHLYAEGWVKRPKNITLTKAQYAHWMNLIDTYYAREIEYLEASKYRFNMTAQYYQINDKTVTDILAPCFYAYVKNDFSVYDEFKDPCRTDKAAAELYKRSTWWPTAFENLIQNSKLSKENALTVVDIGTGPGYTTNVFLNLLKKYVPNFNVLSYDKFSQAQPKLDFPVTKIDDLGSLDSLIGPVLITGFQVFPWYDTEEFKQLVANADYVFYEAICEENKQVLEDNFKISRNIVNL